MSCRCCRATHTGADLPAWLHQAVLDPDGEVAECLLINLGDSPDTTGFTSEQAEAIIQLVRFVVLGNSFGPDDPENAQSIAAIEPHLVGGHCLTGWRHPSCRGGGRERSLYHWPLSARYAVERPGRHTAPAQGTMTVGQGVRSINPRLWRIGLARVC